MRECARALVYVCEFVVSMCVCVCVCVCVYSCVSEGFKRITFHNSGFSRGLEEENQPSRELGSLTRVLLPADIHRTAECTQEN